MGRNSDPNSAAGIARTLLAAAADNRASKAEMVRQITAKGHSVAAANKAIENLVTKRVAARSRDGGEVMYTLLGVIKGGAKDGAKAVKAATPAAAPAMAVGLGARVSTGGRRDDAREEQLLAVLDTDERLTVNDILASLPGWERMEVVRRLRELAERELVNGGMDEERRATVYWLRGSAAARDADGSDASDDVPAIAIEPTAPASAAPRAAMPAPQRPLGLRDRLQAIHHDIEDAIADACDAELPHSLIKALARAGGETGRALQVLA